MWNVLGAVGPLKCAKVPASLLSEPQKNRLELFLF
jgi:hypothetical protein